MLTDLRLALRALLKTPGFTVVALLTLALGIGVNTTMFSVINTLMFQPAPYPAPQELVRIYRTSPQSRIWPHSIADLTDLAQQNTTLAELAYFDDQSFNYSRPGQPAERVSGLAVSANFFTALRLQPLLGRTFTPQETVPGSDDVVILGQDFWENRFGADPTIIGRAIRMDGRNLTVVGVMPASAAYPALWDHVDAWQPLAFDAKDLANRGRHWMSALGRLNPGVSLAAAATEFAALGARLTRDYPETNTGTGFRLIPLHESALRDTTRHVSWLVFALSGFVLLIACANLANLQLVRGAGRQRDFAIRTALGAGRARLIRVSLTESLLLSLVGGAIGLLLAQWCTDAIGAYLSDGNLAGLTLHLDYKVLTFALLAALGTGILFGLLPAWTGSRVDVSTTLKQQTRGSTGDRSQHRLRQAFIITEVALALTLLSGAGYLYLGAHRFTHRDNGWDHPNLLVASLNLPQASYADNAQVRAFHQRLEARLAALPGVEQAALSSSLPLRGYNSSRDLVPEGRPLPPSGQEPLANNVNVSSTYFDTLRIALVQGRMFPADVRPDDPPQVIINESIARQFWPGENPIGKRVGRADPKSPAWLEVIGVVRDVTFAGNMSPPDTRLQFYRPLSQDPWNYFSLTLRTTALPETMAPLVRQAVAELDPDVPVYYLSTAQAALDRMGRSFHLLNQLLAGFALLGLLLSALGLYGVISHLVVQRTPEFGIRVALGAQTRGILWLVLRQGVALTLLGLAVGSLGTLGLLRLLASLLPALPGLDPWLLLATAAGLLAVSILACFLPARRATHVDPIIALRSE